MENNINNFHDLINKCTACSACVNICPRLAIKLSRQKGGYLVSKVDTNICINCGLCKEVCSIEKIKISNFPLICYAGNSIQSSTIKNSASGGVFYEIAKNFIEQKGVVFGVSLLNENNEINPCHIMIEKREDLRKIQGSKYVQSEIGDIFKKVKKILDKRIKVLFSGTPCQIDGLNRFLRNKKYDNLFTIDIICHGVPSNEMFLKYLSCIEERNNYKILNYKFRDKKYGWGLVGSYQYKNFLGKVKKKIFPSTSSSYYSLFLEGEIYRESCYSCEYASILRVSDCTLGDFWGIEKEYPELIGFEKEKLNMKNGISCILVNTNQGKILMEKYSKNILKYETRLESIIKENKQLKEPSQKGKNREWLLNIYEKKGYFEIEKWFKKNQGWRWYAHKYLDNMYFFIKKIQERGKKCI